MRILTRIDLLETGTDQVPEMRHVDVGVGGASSRRADDALGAHRS